MKTTGNNEKNTSDISQFLLKKGYLTDEQIEHALRIQSKLITKRPVLDIVKELQYITDEHIREVIRENRETIRIGDLLVELGYLRSQDLEVALQKQKETGGDKKLGDVLSDNHFIDENKLLTVLGMQLGIPFIEPEFVEIDSELFIKADTKYYINHNFIPIRMDNDSPVIAFADPLDIRDQNTAKELFGRNITTAITSRKSIRNTVAGFLEKSTESITVSASDESMVNLVDSIIMHAIEENNVSDIHFEPMRDRFRIRFRQNGVLVQYRDFPISIVPTLTSRIKILCKADIAEKRRHQDGRFMFKYGDITMDLRVSFYVTVHGEKIVMRLLNRQGELMMNINDIGMFPRMLERFKDDALNRPSGVLIITGPTGSGKTSTVYSCVNYLNNSETSIITAEDPVEYVIDGIAQCSINTKINLTFEETLRHIVATGSGYRGDR